MTYHFRVLWQSCNSSHAIPYELRHNYAIENINGWTYQGFAVHDKLLALSKSMGHRQIESTMAYYSLTPAISDIMACTDNETSKQLMQDVYEKKINSQAMQIAACLHDWLEYHVPSIKACSKHTQRNYHISMTLYAEFLRTVKV